MYGLYTYMAVFYIHPPSRWWGESLPDIRWSLVAAIVTLISMYIHRILHYESGPVKARSQSNWLSTPIAKGLLFYVVWMWIQAPWVISDAHMIGIVLFTKYILLFYLIVSIVDNQQDFNGFCLAHVLGCAFLGWLIFLAPDEGRLEGVGGPGIDNANTLGMHLATGLFFAAFQMLSLQGWRRLACILSIPFILNGIIQTETRGAIVGVLVGGIVTVYLKPKQYRARFYFFAIVGVLAVMAVSNEAFLERMRTLRAGIDAKNEWDSSAVTRIEVAKAQIEMFGDHPLGVGHQGTAYLSRSYLDKVWLASNSGDRSSHNTVLSVLVDQGIVGIVIFAVLAFSIIRILRRMKKLDKAGMPGSYGLNRAMLGGTLAVLYSAGMFAQYINAEVQIWILAVLAILWQHTYEIKVGGSDWRAPESDPTRPGQQGREVNVPALARDTARIGHSSG